MYCGIFWPATPPAQRPNVRLNPANVALLHISPFVVSCRKFHISPAPLATFNTASPTEGSSSNYLGLANISDRRPNPDPAPSSNHRCCLLPGVATRLLYSYCSTGMLISKVIVVMAGHRYWLLPRQGTRLWYGCCSSEMLIPKLRIALAKHRCLLPATQGARLLRGYLKYIISNPYNQVNIQHHHPTHRRYLISNRIVGNLHASSWRSECKDDGAGRQRRLVS